MEKSSFMVNFEDGSKATDIGSTNLIENPFVLKPKDEQFHGNAHIGCLMSKDRKKSIESYEFSCKKVSLDLKFGETICLHLIWINLIQFLD
jgi:hypothetical protein